MIENIRWILANQAMRFTLWLMPESPAKKLYSHTIKSASVQIFEEVMRNQIEEDTTHADK